ncbi:hypothetical protein A2334_05315 [Candidatus Roizmanbacteria bacterium RIFOXYB2_FULL_38_10]|uniref:Inositol monophosphatase n=1 Tax=Candidatus Roizmanbacteria bacterium RIFOXYD1_FULL_38_12 TaxID=1802093 RepID=A0A1F7L0H7_9BACT|nr:MAG: hypothetical protein A3K47_02435 [Candidatus Roizmanbacteria bacterium RIFOXYA2_FULL_38_14]OGK63629.1 MAG: hypothetical protein A3K27_02435 [Candidatus Roizmanbacteria bacterium RIFOXYA1_FULL_37_12]OGK65475.1 MAG: hypothetical protein A3K38_02435 [Candidatus Roizmanbacteria bacterium RIFOXYB1_FULL_40_23]OGK68260.1 MAG: hypothetical protein A2334_05315 [Candidatus Roizmanbacteria bacterium RIFOXYB2_FULL_38_10]OGK69880.1 MAG: hypothetical protein A3K21_02440 [Candidatus Roizmanbacteria ba
MLTANEVQQFEEFCELTLRKAGEILLSFKDTYKIKKTKDPLSLDISTNADFAAEEYIINEIKKKYPGHSILTEETEGLLSKSEFEWVIDPLDGTKEYIRHSPYFYTLLALEYNNELVVGAGYQPEIKRMFCGSVKNGVRVNNHQASRSSSQTLNKSMISFSLPTCPMSERTLKPYIHLLESLTKSIYRLRSTPWDVEALFNASVGIVEGFICPPQEEGKGPKWWDIAPGVLMVRAAGGLVTDFFGHPYHYRSLNRGIVATNGHIHTELLQLIGKSYLS